MTEYDTGTPIPPTGEPSAPRDDWEEVKRSLDALGSAMAKWANAVKSDPENREQAREIKDRFETMGREMGKAIDSATDSEFVRGMGGAASKAGYAVIDAAHVVGREVRPLMASAFRTAAEGMRMAAEKVDDRTAAAAAPAAPEPPAPHEHAPAAPYTPGDEPPAPAPSGAPDVREPKPGDH